MSQATLQAKPESTAVIDLAAVDAILDRCGGEVEALIPILQAMQEHYHYLPEEALRKVVAQTAITPAMIQGVASFYTQFRHKPAGEHMIRVCHGTACHVKGSELIDEAFRRELGLKPGEDTDAGMKYTLERVGCVGCCTLAPVVVVDGETFGHVKPETIKALLAMTGPKPVAAKQTPRPFAVGQGEIRVGAGSCCIAGGSLAVRNELERTVEDWGLNVRIKSVGCVGMCHQTPLVEMMVNGTQGVLYTQVQSNRVGEILRRHFRPKGLWRNIRMALNQGLDALLVNDQNETPLEPAPRDGAICEFLGPQQHLATEYCGNLDPLDVDEYLKHDGFAAWQKAQTLTPTQIVQMIKQSGLRGRGGAGFSTGTKWELAQAASGKHKYLICNGDEGDPGAFMDRMILESYPYRVLEGMAIAAHAIGATEAIFYIRHEYPLAVERVRKAIEVCQQRQLLGTMKFQVREGAGAFVCGEETALIASLEGQRGMPRIRPPYPVQKGLWGQPTCINNVETFSLVPWIVRNGSEAFAAIGTATSKGTKVFALTGKIKRGGLIEVPMGISLRQIVEEIGGGVADGRRFKAVQIGGPSGGCIPAEMADIAVDYESLTKAGAIMGSGGLVVLDDRDCMVDIAQYFLQFTQAESCGKCTFCRIGTKRMLEILDRLCSGKGKPNDLTLLEQLAGDVKTGSLCGLGQTAPNPVLSTLRYFREEYEEHLKGKCRAGKCSALIKYEVNNRCIGCTKCAQECPVSAIPFTPYQIHTIDAAKCTRCDICRRVCPSDAIEVH